LDEDLPSSTAIGVCSVDGSAWLDVALEVTVLEGVEVEFEADSIGASGLAVWP
jgi:hypothetical protein